VSSALQHVSSASLSDDLTHRAVLGYVADTFANKGFVLEDPFALTPPQMMELDAQVSRMTLDLPAQSSNEEQDLPATMETVQSLRDQVAELEQENKQREERLMNLAAPAVDNSPQLLETEAAANRGILRGAFNLAKKAAGFVAKKAASAIGLGSSSGSVDRFMPQRFEDCMACRFVWKQVEMDVSNAKFVEDVQASFEHNCLDAQKSQVFYKACEDMYDDMYAMTDDYMSSDYTVDKMCQRANMCKL